MESSPTPIRARSQESIGLASISRLPRKVPGPIPMANLQNFTEPSSRNFWKNTVTNGMLTTVNCKAIGPTYAANIVYSS